MTEQYNAPAGMQGANGTSVPKERPVADFSHENVSAAVFARRDDQGKVNGYNVQATKSYFDKNKEGFVNQKSPSMNLRELDATIEVLTEARAEVKSLTREMREQRRAESAQTRENQTHTQNYGPSY